MNLSERVEKYQKLKDLSLELSKAICDIIIIKEESSERFIDKNIEIMNREILKAVAKTSVDLGEGKYESEF